MDVCLEAEEFYAVSISVPGCSESDLVDRARLLAGRALAYEGLAQWQDALGDYTDALELARRAGWEMQPIRTWSECRSQG